MAVPLTISRFRRYFVPTLLLLPVIFLCGKLLLTPVRHLIDQTDINRVGHCEMYDHGWPRVYRISFEDSNSKFRTFEFFPWLAALDLAVLLALIGIASWAIIWHRRRHQRWIQVSLKEGFVLVAFFAVVFGWLFSQKAQFQSDSRLTQGADGYWFKSESVYCGPEWLRRIAPEIDNQEQSIFHRAVRVDLILPESIPPEPDRLSASMVQFRELRNLRVFSIFKGSSITIVGDLSEPFKKVEHQPPEDLSSFDQLEALSLSYYGDDDTLAAIDTLPRLRFLGLNSISMTARGLAHITKCLRLETLSVDARITDEEISQLGNLTRLVELRLGQLSVGDASIRKLAQLKELRVLHLRNEEQINDETVQILTTLPHLWDLEISPLSDNGRELVEHLRQERNLRGEPDEHNF